MSAHCCADLADCLALSALRDKYGRLGYRVFRTRRDGALTGWAATWGSSAAWAGEGNGARLRPGAVRPGAILASSWRELADQLKGNPQ